MFHPPSVCWHELTAPELNRLAGAGAIVLVPVGSTEQHGPHLATGTDSILAADVCIRAARALRSTGAARDAACVVTPAVWAGIAPHHVDLGGTFTLSLATFRALLGEIAASVAAAGFRDVVFVNGHGGNMAALTAIAVDLAQSLDIGISTTTYFIEARAEIAAALEVQSTLLHAGEAETSMMLATAPGLVRRDLIADGPGFDMDDILAPRLGGFAPFSRVAPSGVSGRASAADAEKGARLLEAASARLCQSLLTRFFPFHHSQSEV